MNFKQSHQEPSYLAVLSSKSSTTCFKWGEIFKESFLRVFLYQPCKSLCTIFEQSLMPAWNVHRLLDSLCSDFSSTPDTH
ncbi:hypothetical protein CQA44_10995 [Helicobacter sp. MIT 14-3879]|nr:hypothetical protein CQA44_10995 [Helicobacter sp. MIT 14-3879]